MYLLYSITISCRAISLLPVPCMVDKHYTPLSSYQWTVTKLSSRKTFISLQANLQTDDFMKWSSVEYYHMQMCFVFQNLEKACLLNKSCHNTHGGFYPNMTEEGQRLLYLQFLSRGNFQPFLYIFWNCRQYPVEASQRTQTFIPNLTVFLRMYYVNPMRQQVPIIYSSIETSRLGWYRSEKSWLKIFVIEPSFANLS